VPLPVRRCQRPTHTHALVRKLPLYHPLRPLPPLPCPVDVEPSAPPEPHSQATRSSGRTRRPPPRNLEHLIVAVSNTARQRQGSPSKKRKVVVLAADEMDVDVDAESESAASASKKKAPAPVPVDVVEDSTPPVEEVEFGRGARRATRRSGGKDLSVTPTPPPQAQAQAEVPAAGSKPQSRVVSGSGSQARKPRSAPRRVTRRNSDETSSEEKDAGESIPAPVSRRTSSRRTGGSAGVEHPSGIAVSVRA
jgi:hypothetical protein